MSDCLSRVVFLVILFSFFQLQARSGDIPVSLQKELDNYRKKDSLEAWIYARIAYADKEPAARIDFLMQTQQAAWRSYRTYEERLAWFDLLVLQGYYQLQTGNILASITAYERALQFYEAYPLPDAEAELIENVLKPLGNNYTRLADYTTALYIQRKTLVQALKQNDASLIASVYSNMAVSARWQGDLQNATFYCREGLGRAGKNTALRGLLLSTYADILTEQARYDTARIVCKQALQLLNNRAGDDAIAYWEISALQVAARIETQQGKFQQAKRYAGQASQLLQRRFPVSRRREKAKVQVLLGDIAFHSGNAAASLAYYQQALALLIPSFRPDVMAALPAEEALYSENTIADALAGKAFAFMQLGRKEEALLHFFRAFAAEKKLVRELFYTASRYREMEVTRARAEAAMKTGWDLWKTSGNKKYLDQLLLIAELSKAQVLADEKVARSAGYTLPDSVAIRTKQLQQTIAYYQRELITANNKDAVRSLLQSAEYELALLQKNNRVPATSTIVGPGDLEKMLISIPSGLVMLEFFAGKDSSYFIEFSAAGVRSVQLITQKQLQQTVRQFVQHWFGNEAAMINDPGSFYVRSYELYQSIFGNYEWQPGKRYVLIPDGSFNYLPFDALITDKVYRSSYADWPYLCKKNVLSFAYSLQVWAQQQSAEYPAQAYKGFFVSRSNRQQAFLSVRKEYEALRKQLNGEFYVDSSANWDQLNRVIDHSGVLHFSTHGFGINSDSFPKIELYDRPFYLFDLRHQNLATALVVLSACETADGSLIEGEGVNSLSRGFTGAGAGGVVAGLWKMNDEASIGILQSFYRHLGEEDPGMALYKAKQEWMAANRDQAVFQLPYYWAGFVYTGRLQQLSINKVEKKQFQGMTGWYLLAALLLSGILYLVKKRRFKAGFKKAIR